MESEILQHEHSKKLRDWLSKVVFFQLSYLYNPHATCHESVTAVYRFSTIL